MLNELFAVTLGINYFEASLVAHRLQKGGTTLLMNGMRRPDEDNPRGYIEYRIRDILMRWFDAS